MNAETARLNAGMATLEQPSELASTATNEANDALQAHIEANKDMAAGDGAKTGEKPSSGSKAP